MHTQPVHALIEQLNHTNDHQPKTEGKTVTEQILALVSLMPWTLA